MNWVQKENIKPGNIYANIKVHIEGWPYRFIISSKGTTIENLAKHIPKTICKRSSFTLTG